MKGYQGGISGFTDADSVVYGVSTDELAQNQKFAKELGLEFELLSDVDGSVAKAYDVLMDGPNFAKRVTFVIGQDGNIAFVGEGRDAMDPNAASGACAGLE